MTRLSLVKSIQNFGIYLKDNLQYFNENNDLIRFAIEKLFLLVSNLSRHVNERLEEKRSPYGECIVNTFDTILVSILF